jgi:hypothetical protein
MNYNETILNELLPLSKGQLNQRKFIIQLTKLIQVNVNISNIELQIC